MPHGWAKPISAISAISAGQKITFSGKKTAIPAGHKIFISEKKLRFLRDLKIFISGIIKIPSLWRG